MAHLISIGLTRSTSNLIRNYSSYLKFEIDLYPIFFNWDSFHARLNSYKKTWIFKVKKKTKVRNLLEGKLQRILR